MINKDSDILPRTYSVKGYTRKNSISPLKILTYVLCFILFIGILWIAVISTML